eukprot:3860209-Rhodomonas_salina.1
MAHSTRGPACPSRDPFSRRDRRCAGVASGQDTEDATGGGTAARGGAWTCEFFLAIMSFIALNCGVCAQSEQGGREQGGREQGARETEGGREDDER